YYSIDELEPFLKGLPYFYEKYGEDAEIIIKKTDLPVLLDSIKKLKKHDLFINKKFEFSKISDELLKGNIVIVIINTKILEGLKGYNGHFVVITGIDDENVFYHDSGPKNPTPNKKVKRALFESAWNDKNTGNDVLIVRKK
ncbi:MAG: peptidase C39 family protein, partial [Candidatus Nanoarchaeia archaeon]|nr:peptidase C39 family protein [Candidatus Nanoarchaeia archaeon]